jgi:hypothetical protein
MNSTTRTIVNAVISSLTVPDLTASSYLLVSFIRGISWPNRVVPARPYKAIDNRRRNAEEAPDIKLRRKTL